MSGAWGGGRREKSVLKQTPQWAWSLILSRDPESMTRAEMKSWLPQRLRHPGATSSVLYRGWLRLWSSSSSSSNSTSSSSLPLPLLLLLLLLCLLKSTCSSTIFSKGCHTSIELLFPLVRIPLTCWLLVSFWVWSCSTYLSFLYTVPFVYPFTNTTHFWLLEL